MNHLDIEQPIFNDKPHIWVQWKGTDVCCDIHCSCGEMSHFDGDFFYFFKCPHCGQHWEVGTHVSIYPVTEAEAIKATDFVKVPQHRLHGPPYMKFFRGEWWLTYDGRTAVTTGADRTGTWTYVADPPREVLEP